MASMSSMTCNQCGSSDIDTDPARGDAVCTNCGSVLEDSIIVSEVLFEENAHGGASAIGQFVSADGKAKGKGLSGFHPGIGKESREITLRNARQKINQLCQQLRLNQHCMETAFNFFKMALHRRLTHGRRNNVVIAACVYITCRTEGTPHMLIDFSDAVQADIYDLGRTYMKFSNALHINIPVLDPCVYILRFCNKLDFGDKMHEVSMTAARLVQRMKRDWLHTGRRPSGLCGAALLIAARLHDFNRTIEDIVEVVKVARVTIKKRLVEFGETPSGNLTLDEFMTIDLEEEQDPPSFKVARYKDRVQKMLDASSNIDQELLQLQKEIEIMLEDKPRKRKGPWSKFAQELDDGGEIDLESIQNFMESETMKTVRECVLGGNSEFDGDDDRLLMPPPPPVLRGLGPSDEMLGIVKPDMAQASSEDPMATKVALDEDNDAGTGELNLDGINDEEIDSYILSPKEVRYKQSLWLKLNEDYLKEQEEKARKLAEEEKTKGVKKKIKRKRRIPIHASSAGEAIEMMLQEKKISTKINYDVLRSLDDSNKRMKAMELSSPFHTDAGDGGGGDDAVKPLAYLKV